MNQTKTNLEILDVERIEILKDTIEILEIQILLANNIKCLLLYIIYHFIYQYLLLFISM